MRDEIDFFILNELLLNLGAVHSAAELQGMLCGQLCGGRVLSERDWMRHALEFLDIEHLQLDADQLSQLQALHRVTLSLLSDVNFSFMPLLPDDAYSIERRTEELGYWCQGFLHGLGTSGLSGAAQLGPDVADALRDLAQISQVGVDEVDDKEENEAYWLELVEYVKVAVLTIYSELSEQPGQDNNNVVH